MSDFRHARGFWVVGLVVGCSGGAANPATSGQAGSMATGGLSQTGGSVSATGGAASAAGGGSVSATGGSVSATGGSVSATGGTQATMGGSASGGAKSATGGAATGGAKANTGGMSTAGGGNSTGGSKASTGGTSATIGGNATGGAKVNTGGASTAIGGNSTGGAKVNTGGASTTVGGNATGGAIAGTGGKTSTSAIKLPTANVGFDYQIGGAYTPPSGVQVVSRDRNSSPAAGIYNICYVNGFQAQPDEESFWQNQHADLLLHDSAGKIVIDQDWNEMLLDTSTAAKRTALAAVIGGWITKCKTDGFNAVEIDNLDSYSRSTGLLTQANNVAFMALLSAAAHSAGLAIAQKNSVELLGNAATMGTDFAVAEECNRYSECTEYQAVYGNLVFVIEYRQQDFQTGCTQHPELSIVLRDLNVSPAGSSGYVYQGC